MSAIILLILRIALATALYAFLTWVLVTIWRDLKNQVEHLTASQTIPMRLSFMAEEGPKEFRLTKSEIILGRDAGCDCLINDKTVSNRHACLSFHHQQWWLEDLGSTNGTLLNQEPVASPVVVTSGDLITCGKISVTIHLENQRNEI